MTHVGAVMFEKQNMSNVVCIVDGRLDDLRREFPRYRYHVVFSYTESLLEERVFGFCCGLDQRCGSDQGTLRPTNHILCAEDVNGTWVRHTAAYVGWIKEVGGSLIAEQLHRDFTDMQMDDSWRADGPIETRRLNAFLHCWNISPKTEVQKAWADVLIFAWKKITGELL